MGGGDQGPGQGVAGVGVGVVGQHPGGRRHAQRDAFGGVVGVVDRGRGVVGVGVGGDDVEADGGGVGVRATDQQTGQSVEVQAAGVVADLDGELIGTGVALVGVVGERSGGLIDSHRAVLRPVDAAVLEHLVLQGIAIGVGGVERDRDADLGWTEHQGDVPIAHHRRLVESLYLVVMAIKPSNSPSVNGWGMGSSGPGARNGLNSRFTTAVAAFTNPVTMAAPSVAMGPRATVGTVSTSLTVLACLVNAAKPCSSPVTGSSAMDINVNGTSESSPPSAASAGVNQVRIRFLRRLA